jgi:hypothetical protein
MLKENPNIQKLTENWEVYKKENKIDEDQTPKSEEAVK